jgi:hypothetical protein
LRHDLFSKTGVSPISSIGFLGYAGSAIWAVKVRRAHAT